MKRLKSALLSTAMVVGTMCVATAFLPVQAAEKASPHPMPMVSAKEAKDSADSMGGTKIVPANLFTRDAKPPDINSIPVLANMVKAGLKFYYLGLRSGLYGWYIVQNDQVQMVYATQDGKSVLIGGLFTEEGINVTAYQVEQLAKVDKDIERLLTGGQPLPSETAQKEAPRLVAPPLPGLVMPTPGGSEQTASSEGQPVEVPPVPDLPNLERKAPESNGTAATKASAGTPAANVALSPGERLMQDMLAANAASVGNGDAPLLNMVVDPNCPHCKATWKTVRDAVFAGKVQIRLIPIGNISPDSTRAAAVLLAVTDPLTAWDKWAAGDKTALSENVQPAKVAQVNENRVLVDKWNITATPYLVYRGQNGKVKVVQGEPENMKDILADLK